MTQPKDIYWSELAKDTYAKLLRYLLDNYPADVAIKLDEKVENLIKRLRYFDKLCPASTIVKQYHKCVITKQNSLIYRINQDTIEIVAFIDNRSDFMY